MPDLPASAAEQSRLRLNLQILSIVKFNFATYLTIGLPLAVLPGFVHDSLGYSAFWAGVVISLQYIATLLSRPYAGRYADSWGPKQVVVLGLAGSLMSGVCLLLSALLQQQMLASLALLCLGRVILGIGQSFCGTGTSLWGVAKAGSLHIGRVISWNGIVTYGAMAIGAPLGVALFRHGGLLLLSAVIVAISSLAIMLVLPRAAVKGSRARPLPFRAVLGNVYRYGLLLAMGSAGFGVIATFITLFYHERGWDGAAFALTLFSTAFVGMRLLFPEAINRWGGLRVASVCFLIEAAGLFLVAGAAGPWMAKLGALLTGAGFSLVFPAIGVAAVKTVPQQNQGSALATYTAFMDLSLGITGPLAGLVMNYAGTSQVYLLTGLLVCVALGCTLRMSAQHTAQS